MKKLVFQLVCYIVFLVLEITEVISVGKGISYFLPCDKDWNEFYSAPCYLKYDVYEMFFVLLMIFILIILIIRKYIKLKK